MRRPGVVVTAAAMGALLLNVAALGQELLWSRSTPAGIAIDLANDVEGNSVSVGSGIYVVKYDTLGTVLWDLSMAADFFAAVDCDPIGNVVISRETGPVTKVSPAGEILWEIDLADSGLFEVNDVRSDQEGNIFLAGRTGPFAIVKLDPSGALLWIRTEDDGCEGKVCAVDSRGDVVVAGTYWGAELDWLVVKYTADGDKVWEQRCGSFWSDEPYAVCIDSAGDAYVGGGWLVKYRGTDGHEVWMVEANDIGFLVGACYDGDVALYLGVRTLGAGSAICCYDLDAHVIWEVPIVAEGEGILRTLDVWRTNYLSVLTTGVGEYHDQMFTSRYWVQSVGTSPADVSRSAGLTLSPQPVRGFLSIKAVDSNGIEAVKIVDLLGRHVARIVPPLPGGGIVSWDCRDERGALVAPGSYVVRAAQTNGCQLHRVVVIVE